MELFIGCPIWSFKGWVGNFYPSGTKSSEFLREYGRRLTTVEGNTTFYAVPAETTVDDWAEALPESFQFCPKVPKAISHAGRLGQGIERAEEFIRIMRRLGTRLGPMFLQLPPGYAPGLLADLDAFLAAWPEEVRLGVEVRHPGWFDPPHDAALTRLLIERRMARVIIDTRPIRSLDGDKLLAGSVYQQLLKAREAKPDVPLILERTTDFVFLRFIGHPQMEVNRPLMEEWAGYLAEQIKQEANAFVFCHSPENVTAPLIARELHRMVRQRVDIPLLPWEELESGEPRQAPLL